MTRVDFYLLDKRTDSREVFACRLTEKAWKAGHRVFMLAPDKSSATALDELLWTFSQGSFVPHGLYRSPEDVDVHPVLVGHTEPPDACHDVLVSLTDEVPAWFSRFARVAELVAGDETRKAQARDRFRFYRERGYPLETHNL